MSPTYKLKVIGSTDKPTGESNAATVPCPSAHPAVPFPASVLTFQKHAGCAVSPITVQAVTGEQGAQAEVSLAYVPTGHVVAVNAQVVEPRILKEPALQGRHVVKELPPVLVE